MSRGSGKKPGDDTGSDMNIKGGATAVGLGMVVLIAVMILINSYTIVDAGTRGVVKTFGDVTSVLPEGLHFRVPFITSVTHVNVKTQKQESRATAASNDLQTVETTIVLNYRPEPASVGELIENIGPDYVAVVVEPAIQESVKAATAQFNAEELITQRPEVRDAIRDDLIDRLTAYNINVQTVSITNFSFSADFANAVERKQVAEQEAQQAERVLDRVRTESQQRVARAEAEAEARLVEAQAEAEALRLQREVISAELLQLRFIEKWNGTLPVFLSGESGMVPLIDVPTDAFSQPEATPQVTPEAIETPTTNEEPEEETPDEPAPPTALPTATPEQ